MGRTVELIVLLLMKLLVGSDSKCSDQLHVWPLSRATGTSDLISGQSGSSGSLQYQDEPSPFNYKTVSFSAAHNTYIDLHIDNPAFVIEDYAFQMFLYLSSLSGVIFHYKSLDNPTGSNYITEILAEVDNGNVVLSFSNGGFVTIPTNLQTGNWYHVIVDRDQSKEFKLFVNGTKYDESVNVSVKGMPLQLPGTLRLGISHLDLNPLEGSIACVQFHPCKDIDDVTLETCVLPTTTASPTTTTFPAPTSPPIAMHLAIEYDVIVGCSHYSLTHQDTTYTSPGDVIQEVQGVDARGCSILCNTNSDCDTFVIQNYHSTNSNCKIGKKTNSTTSETGSAMFVRL